MVRESQVDSFSFIKENPRNLGNSNSLRGNWLGTLIPEQNNNTILLNIRKSFRMKLLRRN